MEGRWNSTLHPTNSFAMDFSDWNDTHPCVCVFIICSVSFSLFYFVPVVGLFVLCVCWRREFIANTEGEGLFSFFSAWRERDYLLDSGDPQKELHREWASNKGKSGGGKFQNERKGFLHITFFFFFVLTKLPIQSFARVQVGTAPYWGCRSSSGFLPSSLCFWIFFNFVGFYLNHFYPPPPVDCQ